LVEVTAVSFTENELLTLLQAWLWPFFRVAALLTAAPIIGTRSVPARLRLVMALAITAVIVPVLPPIRYIDPISAYGLLVIGQQILIGLAIGTAVRFMFMVFELGGQVIAMQMGLGFAAMVDPQTGNQVPVISQFYLIMATLAFLSLNGHLLLIQILAESFTTLPVGGGGLNPNGLQALIGWTSWLFANAMLIALPAIVALTVINLSFGIMTRAAPQMNIFAVGFPIMMITGVIIMFLTLTTLEPHLSRLTSESLDMARQLAAWR